MSRLFTVTVTREDDWFVAKCLENSVASQGKTIDEAMSNLREAVELFFEDEPLPVLPQNQTYVTTMEVAL